MRKRGQVWVETVIYTLIALVLIGLILSFVKPRINQLQDQAVLQQSITMLNDINNVLLSLSQGGSGNKRKLSINLKKGTLTIDSINDQIIFSMDSSFQYSQPNTLVKVGGIDVYDHPENNIDLINMTINYDQLYNITYGGRQVSKSISQASTPYSLYITNKGGSVPVMDFQLG